MADYEDRLKAEYADHVEDATELEQISGIKNTDPSTLDDALAASALEHEKIMKKQKIGWIVFAVALAFYLANGILNDIYPFFASRMYMFASDFIEIVLVGIAALYLFPAFSSKLFKN